VKNAKGRFRKASEGKVVPLGSTGGAAEKYYFPSSKSVWGKNRKVFFLLPRLKVKKPGTIEFSNVGQARGRANW